MKKVFEQILTWFEDTFEDGKIDDSYHKRIVNGVVSSYVTKAKLKEKLSNIINSFQQEKPEVDLEKEIERYTEETIHLPITHKRTPMDIMESDWVRCAHHFYELGLKARKEE